MDEKKIAVLIRERQDEALRMSLGITLCDDIIDIYVMDRALENSEKNAHNLSVARDLELSIFTNCKDNADMEYLETAEIAERLLDYDSILPY